MGYEAGNGIWDMKRKGKEERTGAGREREKVEVTKEVRPTTRNERKEIKETRKYRLITRCL
jgi:hypothetical protein